MRGGTGAFPKAVSGVKVLTEQSYGHYRKRWLSFDQALVLATGAVVLMVGLGEVLC